MDDRENVRITKVLVYAACFLLGSILVSRLAATTPAEGDEWVVLPVIVNIVDASDASNLDDAIKRANEIFKQAKIRLVVKKTNQNVEIGDKDGDLTEKEGDQALKDGQKEIENTFKDKDGKWDGKGIKITLADDCWVEEPGTIGWAVHRKPVVVVESADANSLGITIVHELIHVLTVTDHQDDPNDVMYPTDEGGTSIDPNDIKEIFPEAKKRGTAFRIPRLPSLPRWRFSPFSVFYSTHLLGATLDEFGDVIAESAGGDIFAPDDPTIQYADIREVSLFAESPFVPGSFARLEIHRGAMLPDFAVDSFFDVFLDITGDLAGPDLLVQIQVLGSGIIESRLIDLRSPSAPPIRIPAFVHINEKFDGPAPILYDHSIETHIPIELLQLNLQSVAPIRCWVDSRNHDFRFPDWDLLLLDQTEMFAIDLTGCCVDPRLELADPAIAFGDDGMLWKGCGFAPNDRLNVFINDNLAETVLSNDKGEVVLCIRPWMPNYSLHDLTPGRHEIMVISADDTRPSGTDYALAFFNYCPQGNHVADLNGDCKVDMFDLALLASEWLAGTTIPGEVTIVE